MVLFKLPTALDASKASWQLFGGFSSLSFHFYCKGGLIHTIQVLAAIIWITCAPRLLYLPGMQEPYSNDYCCSCSTYGLQPSPHHFWNWKGYGEQLFAPLRTLICKPSLREEKAAFQSYLSSQKLYGTVMIGIWHLEGMELLENMTCKVLRMVIKRTVGITVEPGNSEWGKQTGSSTLAVVGCWIQIQHFSLMNLCHIKQASSTCTSAKWHVPTLSQSSYYSSWICTT